MELVTQHYSKSFRRPYERSISEQKFDNRQHFLQDFYKGQNFNLRKIQEDSYQQENSSHFEDCDFDKAKDLRIDKRVVGGGDDIQRADGTKIKRESNLQPHSSSLPNDRRYFCIFCKLDFILADDFLEHLELHPNGSFVLVKRDLPPPSLPPLTPSPKIINHHHKRPNNNIIDDGDDDDEEYGKPCNNKNDSKNINSRSNGHCESMVIVARNNNDQSEDEIEVPMLPEMLKNQIKIEPISEDEEEEMQQEAIHIKNSNSFSQNNHEAPQYNNNNSSTLSCSENQTIASEGSDPNQQLLVLSNPRIGDGPGEYLCNVCQAKFVYKNNLKSHLKRHLGIYPYVCFCGKRYQFKCKLNKHIEQAHAKIKNFKCPVPTCPKKYFTRNDLAFHISVTHQERQEIPCNICQKVFNSQKSLQIHCRKYHRNQES